jgi:probable Rubsico expression protein CbbX
MQMRFLAVVLSLASVSSARRVSSSSRKESGEIKAVENFVPHISPKRTAVGGVTEKQIAPLRYDPGAASWPTQPTQPAYPGAADPSASYAPPTANYAPPAYPYADAANPPPAAFVVETAPTADANAAPLTGQGPSLQYQGGQDADNDSNYRKLGDALNVADIERRKNEEEAHKRENKMQYDREERQRKIDYMVNMPDDMPAGKVDDFMYKAGVQDILTQLDHDLIGLEPVKTRLKEIASLLIVDKMRRKLGLETAVPSLHMVFTGSPGTGKTTVAVKLGQILQKMGYVRTGHVVVATRDDLVGQYVGHTAPKTKEVIKKAMGGILLIDEAYYLYNAANDRDYGQESIEILLNVMEKQQEDLVVVMAGYKDRMDSFFSYIPGMNSRIGNHIDFPDYSADDLIRIARLMVTEHEYEMDADTEYAFSQYLEKRMQMPYFSNARTVRNAMDMARMRAAVRIFNEKISPQSDGLVTKRDLVTLRPEDLPDLSSVSSEEIVA